MVILQRFAILLVVFLLFPFMAHANVVINEIAWMGTESSANDEWIELYNASSSPVDLSGWSLEAVDGAPVIDITAKAVSVPPVISAGGFLLFERTDDTSVSAVSADVIYVGAMGNGGEVLVLKDDAGVEVDRIDGADGWKIGGGEVIGNNTTKQTAQLVNGAWVTASSTPKEINFSVTSSGEGEESATSTSSVPPPYVTTGAGVTVLPVEARAGEDMVVESGKEIILNADNSLGATSFTWYLGDGSVKSGSIVNHIYSFPGRYLVTLEVSNGTEVSIDQLFVSVFGGKVIINEFYIPALEGELSWVEFLNPTPSAIDIGGWSFEVGPPRLDRSLGETGQKIFIFPPHTVLFAGEIKVISEEVFGFSLFGASVIRLRLPNRVLVDEVQMEGAKLGWAAARQNGQFFWTSSPTPTFANIIVASPPVFVDRAVRPTAKVTEAPVEEGKNLIFATTQGVEEFVTPGDSSSEDSSEKVTASLLQDTNDIGRSNLIYWIMGVLSFSLLISLVYISFLQKRKNKQRNT